jgi:hypothetical protein
MSREHDGATDDEDRDLPHPGQGHQEAPEDDRGEQARPGRRPDESRTRIDDRDDARADRRAAVLELILHGDVCRQARRTSRRPAG